MNLKPYAADWHWQPAGEAGKFAFKLGSIQVANVPLALAA